MNAVKATSLLVIRGDTKPAKEVLKKAGWSWNPDAKHWYMRLVSAHAQRVQDNDTVFMFDSLRINRKGCQVTLDGIVVWTSKTYLAGVDVIPGDVYNVDAYGNHVSSNRIPGSAPDDRI